MPISREQGNFLYLVGRTLGARRAVEFGTSFGISTIYLASAIRDNGGELVIGTELEPSKHQQAVANVKGAGLKDITDIRLGDALQTLPRSPRADRPGSARRLEGPLPARARAPEAETPARRRGAGGQTS